MRKAALSTDFKPIEEALITSNPMHTEFVISHMRNEKIFWDARSW